MVKTVRKILVVMVLVVGCMAFNQCSAELVKVCDYKDGGSCSVDIDSISCSRIRGDIYCDVLVVQLDKTGYKTKWTMSFFGDKPILCETKRYGDNGVGLPRRVKKDSIEHLVLKTCSKYAHFVVCLDGENVYAR